MDKIITAIIPFIIPAILVASFLSNHKTTASPNMKDKGKERETSTPKSEETKEITETKE